MSDDGDIRQMLGALIEGQRNGTSDRGEIKRSIVALHQRMDGVAGIPQQFASHEEADERRFAALGDAGAQRHADNTERLDKIEATLKALVTEHDERRGARAFAYALSGLVGAAIAGLAAWLKLRGN